MSSHPRDSSKEFYELGRQAMDRGDIEHAITMFFESANQLAHFKTLELLGECLLMRQRYNEASIYLAAAVALGSKAFRAMYLLSQALIPLGETDKAREVLEEAIKHNPNYKAARELLGTLPLGSAG